MDPWLIAAMVALACLGVGVVAGRYYVPDTREQRRLARHARVYLRAINALLSRDSQTAIDELCVAVKDNVSDIEPYFAIGSLFRSRGETERAIRVHQAIAMRFAKDKAVSLRARFELGLDFRAAGMPRRARRAFSETLDGDDRHLGALRGLAAVQEHEKNHAEAAAAWQRVVELCGEAAPRLPHLLAAAARDAVHGDDRDRAAEHILAAQDLLPDSPHVLATAAEIALAHNDPTVAIRRLRQAIEVRPELAGVLVPRLYAAHAADLSPTDGPATARERTAASVRAIEDPSPALGLAVAELFFADDRARASAELAPVLQAAPELVEAHQLAARLALDSGDPAAIRGALSHLVGSGAAAGGFACSACHAPSPTFSWQCGRCRRWDVMIPAWAVAGEKARDRRQAPRAPDQKSVSRSFWARTSTRARRAVASLRSPGPMVDESDEPDPGQAPVR